MKDQLHIMLADDDHDDRFFFTRVLSKLPYDTKLSIFEDGARLMEHLKKQDQLPDVLFLDMNMPCKNGMECLAEIKENSKLKDLPVIMYSTSLHKDVADLLYENGAHFYIRKSEISELEILLHKILTMLSTNEFTRPDREEFVLIVPEKVYLA